MSTLAQRVSIGLATGVLALGYALSNAWAGTLLTIACGGVWWIGRQRSWPWIASAGLIVSTLAAAFGAWRGMPPAWMLTGAVAALAAWDLDHFERRLQDAQRVGGQRELIRSHLRRLLIATGSGLLLGWLALGVRVELGFGLALLLGLLAFLGLSGAIGFWQRESE